MLNDPQHNRDDQEPARPASLNKSQKWAITGLSVFAVLIVVLWFAQLKNSIYAPLNTKAVNTNGSAQANSQEAKDQALKNKDTDADGLSDYDELNIYGTSPYLDDSDSDGVKDGVEVKNGTDPSCPAGRTCLNSAYLGAGASSASSSDDALNKLIEQSEALNGLLEQANANNQAANSANASGSNGLTGEQLQALKNLDAASVRQMLLESGMPKSTLDKISDTELMKSYLETLNSK
ncbi:MAG: thrombospondin type 3 repeat-containing protein [Patescibacteria group bacterium]|nr:thrombospondin type 3 repeat-containing protein [Patescibacteria group bacterium]